VLPVGRPERYAQRVGPRSAFQALEGSASGNNSDGVLGCSRPVGVVYGALGHARQAAVRPPVQTPRDVMPGGGAGTESAGELMSHARHEQQRPHTFRGSFLQPHADLRGASAAARGNAKCGAHAWAQYTVVKIGNRGLGQIV
jgi:hypothetical protein